MYNCLEVITCTCTFRYADEYTLEERGGAVGGKTKLFFHLK